jgi:hypothetical protein
VLEILGWALLAIVVAGGLCALAVYVLPAGEQIAPALRDEPVWALPPDRALEAVDVDTVRLPVAFRGYRFAETDLLLDRLASEIRLRDAEIADLRGEEVATLPATAGADETEEVDAVPAADADDPAEADGPAGDDHPAAVDDAHGPYRPHG